MITFEQAGSGLGLTVCRGIDPRTGSYCQRDHDRGELADGLVHWRDRRMSRASLRMFLLVAAGSNPVIAGTPPGWARTYLANRWAVWAAGQLGMKLPKHLSDTDRARVKAQLVSVPTDAPLRKEAMRWSTR